MTESERQSELVRLYRLAFAEHGPSALWSCREIAEPTAADALVIARRLRIEGNMDARRLAEQIEQMCRAADTAAK